VVACVGAPPPQPGKLVSEEPLGHLGTIHTQARFDAASMLEDFSTAPQASDQGFRVGFSVGGGTSTRVFRVPTRSNPKSPTLLASRRRRAVGRRSCRSPFVSQQRRSVAHDRLAEGRFSCTDAGYAVLHLGVRVSTVHKGCSALRFPQLRPPRPRKRHRLSD
jgi:hypothetical protein